jgi:hypothetical protein
MFKHCCVTVLTGFLVLMPAHALVPEDESIADVRCVIIGVKIAASADSAQQSAGVMAALYYIGRIDGREPTLNIETVLAKEVVNMTPTEFSSEAIRCGKHLTERGQEITKLGRDLAELAQKMPGKPKPPEMP